MSEDTNIVADAAREMDKQLKNVMPDTWMGHARLALQGEDLHGFDEDTVLARIENVVEDKDMAADRVARLFVEKMEEKA
jgi:hypothetical protein